MTAFAARVSPIADRLDIPAQGYRSHGRSISGWQDDIRKIVDLARSNGIPVERIAACRRHSIEGLTRLMPQAGGQETARVLDDALGNRRRRVRGAPRGRQADAEEGDARQGPAARRARRLPPRERHATVMGGLGPASPSWGRRKATRIWSPTWSLRRPRTPRHPALREDVEHLVGLQFDCAAQCLAALCGTQEGAGPGGFHRSGDAGARGPDGPCQPRARLREMIGRGVRRRVPGFQPHPDRDLLRALAAIAPDNVWGGRSQAVDLRLPGTPIPALTQAAAHARHDRHGRHVLGPAQVVSRLPEPRALRQRAAFEPNFPAGGD